MLAADDSTPGVLAGDMNSQADTEVMKILTERWTDMFAAPAPLAPPNWPMRRVDYVPGAAGADVAHGRIAGHR